jgi:L-fucose isomerase-like protein
MQLTAQENEKFALWLLQDAESNEQLAKQMESLPGTSSIAKKYRTEAMAQRIVAAKLQSYEKTTL